MVVKRFVKLSKYIGNGLQTTSTDMGQNLRYWDNKKLCCRKEAARCFVCIASIH